MVGNKELQALSVIFCFLFMISVSQGNIRPHRNLSPDILCPNATHHCENQTEEGGFINVAYTRADSHKDTLHYFFTSFGLPTLLVARTKPNSNYIIKWDKFLSGNISEVKRSLTFKPKADYVYAVVFTKLIEYDDRNDTADLEQISNNDTFWNIYSLQDMAWDKSHFSIVDTSSQKQSITFNVTKKTSMSLQENGSFSITWQIDGQPDRNSVLPHLEFTANTSQFDIRLDGLNPTFNNSRFALEIVLVTSDGNASTMELKTHRSIDDEHSPGTFNMIDWTSRGDSQTDGAFLQWKPVCYIKPDYNTRSASYATEYGLKNYSNIYDPDLKPYLLYAYFGNQLTDGELEVMAVNISFGLIGDKFYEKTSYTGWMLNVGVGPPPSDRVSLLIILIISIGLGTPVVLLVGGGIGVCIKRNKNRKNAMYVDITSAYTPIQ